MKHLKKAFFLSVALAAGLPAGAQTVAIDPDTKYQHIDGFGGCGMNGQWGDVYTQEKVDLLWGKGEDAMGYNIMRIRISPNESGWNSYVNPVKWAKAHGTIVFATPWTPPHRFKINAEQPWGDQTSISGNPNPDSLEVYAQWLERYRQHMEDVGAPIDILSIQNECDYDTDYESCVWSVDEMAKMVQLAKKYINCKIMGPECFGWDSHKYNLELANKSAAVRASIDIWGNHIYGTNDWSYVKKVTDLTKKPMWMTEICQQDKSRLGKWSDACDFAEQVDSCMRVGFSAYVYYNMLDNFFGDGTDGSKTSQPGKWAYILSHYAKFATGKTRIQATFSNTSLKGTAYMSEDGDTISLFILNPGATSTTLRVRLPFACAQVHSVITNEFRNFYQQDVSEEYGGTLNPRLSIMASTIHTFQFVRTEATETPDPQPGETTLLDAYKAATQVNPINPFMFCGDPTAIEHDGRVYVYATNDQQQFDLTNGFEGNNGGRVKSLVVMSSADMANWTYHGTIDLSAICGSWLTSSRMPSIVSRVEEDGLTHFYLYFSNGDNGIGVITSTSPTGPWTDPLGHALISASTSGLGLCAHPSDPGAAIDDDGTGWLAFGCGEPNAEGTDLMPGNARIVRLGKDMISLDSDIVPIPAPYHSGSNELNVLRGWLAFSYCTSWSERTDWPSYGTGGNAPSSSSICYMITNDPLDPDSWSYKGEYFAKSGLTDFPRSNNHAHLQKYGNSYYLFYHTPWLEQQMDITGDYHSVGVNTCNVTEGRRVINPVTQSNTATLQLVNKRPDPFTLQTAETLCTAAGIQPEAEDGDMFLAVADGGWTMMKSAYFGNEGIGSFTARLKGEGTLEVRLDDLEAEPIATIDFAAGDWEESTVACDSMLIGAHDVYLVFTGTEGNAKLDTWQFTTQNGTGIQQTDAAEKTPVRNEYYTVSGIRLKEKPASGIVICRTYYSDGSMKASTITVR